MKILIAEDHPMFREGLAAMLGDRPDVETVVAVGSGREAVVTGSELQADVAIVDLQLPDGDGLWVTRELQRCAPATRVLVLTSAEDDRSVTDALDAGANGYLLKTAAPQEISDAVTAVAAGASVVSDDVLAALTRRVSAAPGRAARPFPQLTEREFEVLTELALGHGTDLIAGRLGMSAKTVRNHVSNVLSKLGVQDRVAAAVVARANGLG